MYEQHARIKVLNIKVYLFFPFYASAQTPDLFLSRCSIDGSTHSGGHSTLSVDYDVFIKFGVLNY